MSAGVITLRSQELGACLEIVQVLAPSFINAVSSFGATQDEAFYRTSLKQEYDQHKLMSDLCIFAHQQSSKVFAEFREIFSSLLKNPNACLSLEKDPAHKLRQICRNVVVVVAKLNTVNNHFCCENNEDALVSLLDTLINIVGLIDAKFPKPSAGTA